MTQTGLIAAQLGNARGETRHRSGAHEAGRSRGPVYETGSQKTVLAVLPFTSLDLSA